MRNTRIAKPLASLPQLQEPLAGLQSGMGEAPRQHKIKRPHNRRHSHHPQEASKQVTADANATHPPGPGQPIVDVAAALARPAVPTPCCSRPPVVVNTANANVTGWGGAVDGGTSGVLLGRRLGLVEEKDGLHAHPGRVRHDEVALCLLTAAFDLTGQQVYSSTRERARARRERYISENKPPGHPIRDGLETKSAHSIHSMSNTHNAHSEPGLGARTTRRGWRLARPLEKKGENGR